jgi:rhamnosyltransferase subunit B
VLLFALGSGGDVFPTIGVARNLAARGHHVAVATNPYFESSVQQANVEFLPLGSAAEYCRRLEDPSLWQFGKGFKVLFREMLDNVRPVYDTIEQRWTPGRTIVVAPTMAFGARIANEKLGVPLVNLQLQPLAFRSLREQPGLEVPVWLQPLLPAVRRPWLAALDKWVLDAELQPRLNAIRAELGLPPVRRVFNGWIYSPDLVLGLFPDWFAQPQPDWPRQAQLTGFPFFHEDTHASLPPGLEAFLSDGEPPIVFTLGTAMRFAAAYFEASVEVCRILKRRGVLLTRFRHHLPNELPADVMHVEFVPLGTLLPRSAGIVHHGGIGTLAQALRAGVPQLVTPMNFDQPDNARRVVRLGVADRIRLKDYQPAAVAQKLSVLLDSADVRGRCRAVANALARTDAVTATCHLIESVDSSAIAPGGIV